MIYEVEHQLTRDERNTLLFLTGGLRLLKCNELSDDEVWNLKEFFGYNRPVDRKLLRVIIFKDKVVTKLAD